MKRHSLDEIIAGIRSEEPDAGVVRESAKRVFRNVFDAAHLPERVERIRGCSDFEALIPAYLERRLSPARVSLLEDHVSHCVECRRALQFARNGEENAATESKAAPITRRRPVLAWAMGAALAAGLAIGVTGAFNGLLPGQHAVRATVYSVEGTLYRMNEFGSSVVAAGAVVRNAEELRTAKGSRAIFRLLNGALVEMGERSNVSVSRNWSGTSVEVESGRVIVRSDTTQKFLVAAGDLRIPVRNAVFAVNRGMKGSRVAVAKGSTRIGQAGRFKEVDAGQQFSSDYRLTNVSLDSEFSWSKNADYYRGLLSELSTLQKQWQAIPAPNLRYASNLTRFVPADTVVYVAIPNVGGTLTEAKKIFDQRLAESEVLRDWWQRQPASRNGGLDRALQQIAAISEYLGDEIVLAVGSHAAHQYSQPLLLAEVRRPGLEQYLKTNLPPGADLSSFLVTDRIVAASPDAAQLGAVSQAITTGTATAFAQAPFFSRVAQSYASGAGYLLAADMEQMMSNSVHSTKGAPQGMANVRYLVLERKSANGSDTETRAALSFSGNRQGVASWLGAPGPMGSLDFVSPDANFAVSFVMKNPLTVVQEMMNYAGQTGGQSKQGMESLQQRLGVNVMEDLVSPFGGDATFAIDGPLVPIPSWKMAIEVYDPAHLQQTIQTLVDHFNQQQSEGQQLHLASQQVDGRTFYELRSDRAPKVPVYYTFVNGYLLAGSSEGNLIQAIQNRGTGYTLVSSSTFQEQLPADHYANFSAVIWHNTGKSLQALGEQLKSTAPAANGPVPTLAALFASTGPGVVCIYGEPDRIVAATKGDFMGFNLGTLAGIGQGRPLPWLMASRGPQ